MKVLMVDDQRSVVESLKKGIHWEKLGVEQVYTACSAQEAKLVLVNFDVDLLITDIEMPQEDGIALAEWTRRILPDMEVVFLTSHPDFGYAQNAIRLQIFDYVLQPVRFQDIEKVIEKAGIVIGEKREVKRLKQQSARETKERNALFDSLVVKCCTERNKDAAERWKYIREKYGKGKEIYLSLIKIQHWMKVENRWDDSLISMIFVNVLEELFVHVHGCAFAANVKPGRFWLFLFVDQDSLSAGQLQNGFRLFADFMKEHSDFHNSIYLQEENVGDYIVEAVNRLLALDEKNKTRDCGLFSALEEKGKESRERDIVAEVIEYVRDNVRRSGWNNITRADAAAHVYVNPEYLSRLFKEKTGVNFKDFVLEEKMKMAAGLLENTQFAVGIIASKTGFDNFSHFSSVFKKYYQCTPLEYRKHFFDKNSNKISKN